jgi:hypothetical protein
VMKSVALGQQACETNARSAGRELVGSTLMGAALALLMWLGLSVWPSLWMLVLWLMAAGLYAGAGMFGTRRSRFSASYWSNALVTSLILLGPAIADSAGGKGVLEASATRVCLYLGWHSMPGELCDFSRTGTPRRSRCRPATTTRLE